MGRVTGKYMGVGDGDGEDKTRPHPAPLPLISSFNISDKVFILRLSMTPSDTRIPFKFQRKQFPITSRDGLKILIFNDDGEDTNVTSNVVYHEVFRHVS
ncbi:hypothetical protein MTR_5g055930 [Medicago truncatula]|uniref:Uncharacterized protein n=1 Tax=Medicago truncatula TaxID=3880 RepID=G7K0I1_MEDTR|nr:hypothetical protein MTR_5g055930 [Medicago truncatula]